jgi:hypothetical protein
LKNLWIACFKLLIRIHFSLSFYFLN